MSILSRATAACLLAAILPICGVARGQETTRCTKTTKLDGSGNLGNKTPRPAFKLDDVTVKKCLTVNKKTGEVEQTCRFENHGRDRVKFLFCNMIELSSAAADTTHSQSCSLGFDATAMKWKCFPDPIPGGFSHAASFHFGCRVVDLAAGAKDDTSSSEQSDDFKGKEAKDFQVAYADVFDLSIADTAGDCGFESATCGACFGRNTGTNFSGGTGAVPGRSAATGYWIMSDVPITDPFVRWQETIDLLHPTEYVSIHDALSVPSQFPVEWEELGRALPDASPPASYSQDLLLWDIFTMSDPSTVLTPVVIEAFVEGGESAEVTVAAIPEAVTILGPAMEYGALVIHQPGEGLVPEGTVVEFSIGFLDPAQPDTIQLWEQDGRAIQDTVPPLVEAHSARLDGLGNLAVSIIATDATTPVVGANLFYSSDGADWRVEPLKPVLDPLDEALTNRFTGSVPLELVDPLSLQVFYNVQDNVLNHVWFGPVEVRLEPRIFGDGFELGDTRTWSRTVGGSKSW